MNAVRYRIAPLIFLAMCGSAVALGAQVPGGVSPGYPDRIVEIGTRCPTFSWQDVPDAAGYELLAYSLPVGVEPAAVTSVHLDRNAEVLYARVPGGATSWTPALDQCLAPGGSFTWFVRGIFEDDMGEEVPGEWSDGLFFAVSAAPSSEEVERALRVLQRYVGEDNEGTAAGEEVVALEDRPASRVAHVSSGTIAAPKSVPVAATAIRGHLTEPTGEVYGVVGVIESPDGAGLAAANLAGGADLILDGSSTGELDLLLDQNSLNLPSPSNQTFWMRNTGGGMLNLEVEGVLFGSGSGLSDVDAAALGGILPTEWTAKAELATSGGTAVHWDNLSNVPGDLADGDQDTTYTAGPGLVLDGSELSTVWPGTSWGRHISTTLDSTGEVGHHPSITVGVDGLGLISYYDETNHDLKVAHCDDVVCSTATTTTVDSTGDVGYATSITVGSDGLGLITYYDLTNGDLKVAHCSDLACSSATIATVDSGGTLGANTSVVIGADGLGLISYQDSTNSDLKVAHCSNLFCSTATTSTIDSAGFVGSHSAITIGSDRLGLISYVDDTNLNLKAAHCDNVSCTSATTTTIDSSGNVWMFMSITLGIDGVGMMSYWDGSNNDLKVAHCSDVACSSATLTTIDVAGDVGSSSSIAVGSDGRAVVSYYRYDTGNLKVAHCNEIDCTSASVVGVDSDGNVGAGTSLVVGPDGLPLIAYRDQTNGDLKVVHCSNRFCIPHVRYR